MPRKLSKGRIVSAQPEAKTRRSGSRKDEYNSQCYAFGWFHLRELFSPSYKDENPLLILY